MRSGVIPKRGLGMETIAGVFSAIARGLRGLFDLASMAVGVAPTQASLVDAAAMPITDHDSIDPTLSRRMEAEEMLSWTNPTTGLSMSGGMCSFDTGGVAYRDEQN